MKPGPEKGPCGCNIKYYAVLVNGGDKEGKTAFKRECVGLHKLFQDQGYEVIYLHLEGDADNINTEAKIKAKLEALRTKVRCVDRVLVYLKGHGNWNGGVYLRDNSGKNLRNPDGSKVHITPEEVNTWLDIPACPSKKCDVKRESCFVSIVVSACKSGRFVDVLARQGKAVATSSYKKCSYSGGG